MLPIFLLGQKSWVLPYISLPRELDMSPCVELWKKTTTTHKTARHTQRYLGVNRLKPLNKSEQVNIQRKKNSRVWKYVPGKMMIYIWRL